MRGLHTIAPRPLQRTCWTWRQLAAQWGDFKNSWIAPLSAIITIIIIIIWTECQKNHVMEVYVWHLSEF